MLNKSLDFLKDIAVNNDRDWFAENREQYEEAREEFEHFVQLVINRISLFDPSIMTVDPKEAIFRIYRDVRFSKNKLPYKQHMGAYINAYGRKSPYCGYYVHLQPGNSFLGGGSISLPTVQLNMIRNEIMHRIEEYRSIVEDPAFKRFFPVVGADFLKTAPRGFSKDYPYIDYLRCKEYICSYPVNETFFSKPDCLDLMAEAYIQVQRFGDFINSALGDLNE